MSRERKAVLVKFPLDEFLAIEAARGSTDRSTWIRARLREALLLAGRPGAMHFIGTEADPQPEPAPDTITRW